MLLKYKGFLICQVVTDNLSVKTIMLKEVCGNKILSIAHPKGANRILFINYDYYHIIKKYYKPVFVQQKMTEQSRQQNFTMLFVESV